MNITNVKSITNNKPSSTYFKAFAKTFEDIHKSSSEADDSFENYLKRYLVVITAKFKPLAVGIKEEPFYLKNDLGVEHRPSAMNEFGRCMFKLNKYLVGGGPLGRKIEYQPRGFACLDFAGTKHGFRSDQLDIHFHAAAIIHPSTKTLFTNALMLPEQFCTDRMKTLHMSLYDPTKIDVNVAVNQRLERLISYLSKGAAQWIEKDHGDYWTMLPMVKAKSPKFSQSADQL